MSQSHRLARKDLYYRTAVIPFFCLALIFNSAFARPPDPNLVYQQQEFTPTPEEPPPLTPTNTTAPEGEQTPATPEPTGTSTEAFTTPATPSPTSEPTEQTPVEPPEEELPLAGINWRLDYALHITPQEAADIGGQDAAQDQVLALLQERIADPSIEYRVQASEGSDGRLDIELQLSGTGGIDQLRQVLYANLKDQVQLLAGPLEVLVSGEASTGMQFEVLLDRIVSSGYDWDASSTDPAEAILYGQASATPKAEGVGVPEVVSIPFRAAGDGETVVELAYRRSFEPAAAPDAVVWLWFEALPDVIDLSDPNPVTAVPATANPAPITRLRAFTVQSAPLPEVFDWRAFGKVTPVKNQGGCGACWAFDATAIMESALAIQMNLSVDLSEQYLVSCNDYGFSCLGGWFSINDFHADRYISPQAGPGAVLEADFPYAGRDPFDSSQPVGCTQSFAHPYRIQSWSYVPYLSSADASDGIPDIQAIKNAVQSYGPVATGICIAGGFSDYAGGVFGENEAAACGESKVNHAVVIVGWDDTTSSWIVKNSWGDGWGEGGFMRIRYGISNIGYGANYVVLSGPLEIPTLTAPEDGATLPSYLDGPAVFEWSTEGADTAHNIQISTDSDFAGLVIDALVSGSSFTTPEGLPGDSSFFWRVRTFRQGTYGGWSQVRQAFTLPETPDLLAPEEGITVDTLRPVLAWALPHGSREELQWEVQVARDDAFEKTVFLETTNSTALTPERNLPRSTVLHWRVRTLGLNGASAWSPGRTFHTPGPPATPTLLLPAGGATLPADSPFTPTFEWSEPAGSPEGYVLQIAANRYFEPVYASVETTSTRLTLEGSLPPDLYYWRVQAYKTEDGQRVSSPWSGVRSFKTRSVLTGWVTGGDGIQPVAGAEVSLTGTDLATTTDDSGYFVLAAAPGGIRTVMVSAEGYLTSKKVLTIKWGAEVEVRITLAAE